MSWEQAPAGRSRWSTGLWMAAATGLAMATGLGTDSGSRGAGISSGPPEAAGAAAGSAPTAARMAASSDSHRRPGLLLITLDTTRADHLGCYGYPKATTPRLDSLARDGVLFQQVLSPAPLTLPSHCSLMTGLPPRRHGVRDNALFRLADGSTTLAERLSSAGYTTAAYVSAAVLDRRTGIGQGFGLFDDRVRVGERSEFNYEERAASRVTTSALATLRTIEPPFFLWVHYYDPHFPYVPPEPYRSRFSAAPYDGEIAFVDECVGRLLEVLDRRGLAKDCFVVVAGDHGESLGEHGEATHDVFVYQATQRVPLLIRGPRIARGLVVKRLAGLVDVMPTLLDLLGLPPESGVEGRSLAPLLRGMPEGRARQDPEYELESFFPAYNYGWSPLNAIVRGRWKYIEAPRPELYDIEKDPGESRNLFSSRPEEAARLLAEVRERFGAGTPLPAAPEPDAGASEHRRRLASLGYLAGGGGLGTGQVRIDPKDGIALVRKIEQARRDLQLGRPADGVPLLEEVLRENPENLPAMTSLVSCLVQVGEVDRAIELGRMAARSYPDFDFVHSNLASALTAKAAALRRSRALPPPSSTGKGSAGEAAAAEQEAEREFERALALNPRNADTSVAWAVLEMDRQRPSAALKVLQAARAAGVEDPDAELMLGLIEAGEGNNAEAASALDRALSLDPRSAPAHEAAGRLAYQNRDFQVAADHYEKALALRPEASLARTLGSIRLYDLRDSSGALAAYRKALELDPAGPDAPSLREMIHQLEEGDRGAVPPGS